MGPNMGIPGMPGMPQNQNQYIGPNMGMAHNNMQMAHNNMAYDPNMNNNMAHDMNMGNNMAHNMNIGNNNANDNFDIDMVNQLIEQQKQKELN